MYFVALMAPNEAKTESIEACQKVRKTTDWNEKRKEEEREVISDVDTRVVKERIRGDEP